MRINPCSAKPKYYTSDTALIDVRSSAGATIETMKNAPKASRKLIAVVDDDESIRLATDRFLRSRGYAVEAFSSAGAFLRSVRLSEASCVITDVRMPVMGGIELQAIVRYERPDLPFIFITAFPEASVRLQALNGGATCFLSKPFDAPTLVQCLETALGTQNDESTPCSTDT